MSSEMGKWRSREPTDGARSLKILALPNRGALEFFVNQMILGGPMKSLISITAFLFVFSSSAFAQVEDTGVFPIENDIQSSCEASTNAKPWSHCIYRQVGSDNPDVIYFLHGAGSNSNAYMQWAGLRAEMRLQNKKMPTVIGVSFGAIWLLAEKNESRRSGLLPYFVETVMPFMENKIGGLKGRRLLLTKSMGSFNGAQLVMKYPDLFSRAALICPAITTLSPFATNQEVNEFVRNTPGAQKLKVLGNIEMGLAYFPNKAAWAKADPLVIGLELLNERTPPLYIASGRVDDYGFFGGSQQFAAIAQTKRVSSAIWAPNDGDHCVRDEAEISRFLMAL